MRTPMVTAGPRDDDCGSDGDDRQEERSESEFDFSEELFGTSRPARLKLSRGQRRENSRKRQMGPKTTMSQDQEDACERQRNLIKSSVETECCSGSGFGEENQSKDICN